MHIKKYLTMLLAVVFLATAQMTAAAGLPDFSALAGKCGPAVVNINTERKTNMAGPEEFFGEMFRNMPPGFEKFFEHFGGLQGQSGKRPSTKQKSLGSGFIISADGYIVTNNHVVADADIISVTLDENRGKSETYKAKLVGSDEETDLALLKVDAKHPLPYLSFGDSDKLKVGEWLLAIGNPFGLDHTVTSGILSAKNRNIHAGPFDNFLQTDASINPGNSGGPLLNMDGQVVGINTAIIASGQGIGFAIPSNMAAKIIEQIKSGKKVSRGWLGVSIQDVDDDIAKALGMKKTSGALIAGVMDGEPAAKAGLKDGDIILKVDGDPIENASALLRSIADKAPGSSTVLGVWRNGQDMDVKVVLGERKSNQSGRSGGSSTGEQDESRIGLTVRPLDESERRELDLPGNEGLLILSIAPDKPAAEADLRKGDVILKANLKPVSHPDDLAKIVKDEGLKRGSIMLQILRRGNTYFRTIPLGR